MVTLIGFSVTVESIADCEHLIDALIKYNCNAVRLAFSGLTAYISGSRYWNKALMDYMLNTPRWYGIIILDCEHFYPPTSATATTVLNHKTELKNELLGRALPYNGNPRVILEIFNEFNNQTYFYSLADEVTDFLRVNGITNEVNVNLPPSYSSIIKADVKLDSQGYHFYFNSWSVSGAITWIDLALSKGIVLICTEQGADSTENITASTTSELNQYLAQCYAKGVSNLVWLNYWSKNGERRNLNLYESAGLVMPSGEVPPPPPPPVYECPICGAEFASEIELEEHIQLVHPEPPPLTHRLSINSFPPKGTAKITRRLQ